MKNILLNNKQFCYILVFFFSIYQSWSQVDEKEYGNNTDPISLLSISTDVNNSIECKDINIINSGAPNLRQDRNGYTPYSYLQLYIDNNLAPYNWYQLDVIFNVVTLNSNGTNAETREVPMSVTYNPNTSIGGIGNEFSDLNFLKIENRYGLRVNIKPGSLRAIDLTTNLPITPSNAFVKLGFAFDEFGVKAPVGHVMDQRVGDMPDATQARRLQRQFGSGNINAHSTNDDRHQFLLAKFQAEIVNSFHRNPCS